MAELQAKTYQEGLKLIQTDAEQRVYVFSGEERFLTDTLLKQLRTLLIDSGLDNLDFQKFDCRESCPRLDEVQLAWQTEPFGSRRRLIYIEEAPLFNGPKEQMESWRQALTTIGTRATVIFYSLKVDRRYKQVLASLAAESALWVDCPRQALSDLCQWLGQRAKQANLQLDRAAAEEIVWRADQDLRVLRDEWQKIVFYCHYAAISRVTPSVVSELCRPNLRVTVFNLLDALIEGRAEQALQIVQQLQAAGEKTPAISFMVYRQIRQLIAAKAGTRAEQVAQELKLPPFVAKRLLQQASAFRQSDLIALYRRAFECDWRIKHGYLSDDMGLELMLFRLLLLVRRGKQRRVR